MEHTRSEVGLERFLQAQENLVTQSTDYSLRTLTHMINAGTVDLAPGFQRRERWDIHRQSALIESFLMNVPVPPIYLSESTQGTYQVIDGKQRLTAIARFLSGDLRLRGLEQFDELDGFTFSELPQPIQNALDFRPLRTVTLLRQSDEALKFQVFLRLNTGGGPLSD